jgi:hypothetical protein
MIERAAIEAKAQSRRPAQLTKVMTVSSPIN